VTLVDDLFDCLVFELDGVFRWLHLLFSISVLTSYLSTDLGEYQFEYLLGLFPESLRGQVAGVTGDAFVGRWPRHSEILIDVSKRAGRWRALDDSWVAFECTLPCSQ
jgi:hypothetical protein